MPKLSEKAKGVYLELGSEVALSFDKVKEAIIQLY